MFSGLFHVPGFRSRKPLLTVVVVSAPWVKGGSGHSSAVRLWGSTAAHLCCILGADRGTTTVRLVTVGVLVWRLTCAAF